MLVIVQADTDSIHPNLQQLACIMEVLGVPDKHIVDRSSRKKLFFGGYSKGMRR